MSWFTSNWNFSGCKLANGGEHRAIRVAASCQSQRLKCGRRLHLGLPRARSWPLSRRSGRCSALTYPPLSPPVDVLRELGSGNRFGALTFHSRRRHFASRRMSRNSKPSDIKKDGPHQSAYPGLLSRLRASKDAGRLVHACGTRKQCFHTDGGIRADRRHRCGSSHQRRPEH